MELGNGAGTMSYKEADRVGLMGKGKVRNLASRVLGLSLRRLSGDMRAVHGFPVLLAETFVDPSRFSGSATGRRTGGCWA